MYENIGMKRSRFNLSGMKRQAFAPPMTDPDVDHDVDPDIDPGHWGDPDFNPGTKPKIDPDRQNKNRSGGPGPGTIPDTEEETETPPPMDDPYEWTEPNFTPGRKPKVDPDPQNNWFKRAMGAAGWHEGTDAGVKRTWDAISRGNDPHRNHATQTDFFRQHAHELAQASSHHAISSLREGGAAPNMNSVMMGMQQLMGQLMAFESAHKAQLERLAEAIAAKKLGLPKEMFKAELVRPGRGIEDNPHEHGRQQNQIQQQMGEDNLDTMDVNDAIEAQIPMQFLAQGAGLNTMMNFQAIAEGLIDDARVPPDVVAKYHRLAKLLAGCHFTFDFYGNQAFGGNMGVNDMVDEEWEDEEGHKGEMKIHAKAVTFPLLVYELVAGGIRINSLHAFNDNEAAVQNAEHLNAATGAKSVEALAFQSGGELDRKMHSFVDHLKQKYPTVDYGKIMKSLYIAAPADRTLFFSALMRGDFDAAAGYIRPRRR